MKEIRTFEAFAGYGSQLLALRRLEAANPDKIKVVPVGISEIDPHAIKAYHAVHGEGIPNYGDISKIDWLKVPDFDLFTYSSPCITEDMLILTEHGYKPMRDVVVGDLVLTKSNTMHRVLKKFDNGIHKTYYLNAMGCENIHCTSNHKFYVRQMSRVWNNSKRTYIRKFSAPDFVEASQLTKQHYLGIPVNSESTPFYTADTDFWYMVGMYVGDGWLSVRGNEVLICGNEKKINNLSARLSLDKYHWSINSRENNCMRLRFNNKDIYSFLRENIGIGCEGKRIPKAIIDMPYEQLHAFYQGYLNSDGCTIKGNIVQFTSVNKNLIYSVSAIINKLFNRPTCIYKNKAASTTMICGRVVNQKNWYQLRFRKMKAKQDHAFYEDGYIWYPFHSLIEADAEHVYNMEIEIDHSYILQGCISKNCQDFSSAGLQRGGEKGSGTRSSLLWECERAIAAKRPKYLLMENVAALVTNKFIKLFNKWQRTLENYGYRNFPKVLNAKDYGVPQNRERIFMVSILDKNAKFFFPKQMPLKKRLLDVLEKKVDDRYYLKNVQLVDKFSQKETNEPQLCCAGSLEGGVYTNKFDSAKKVYNSKGIAPTILAQTDGLAKIKEI